VSRREFWKLLSEFLAQGITILMATPYLDEAERCSRVALLHEGHLMALDTPASLRASLPGVVIEVIAADRDRAVHVTLAEPAAELPGELVGALESAGAGVDSIETLRPSLEDVFIERTGG
jgi:ABC-2 type transport system ATP-binding protein